MDIAELDNKSKEELLAFHNMHSKRQLKKFADMPTAIAKVAALIEKMAADAAAAAARAEAGSDVTGANARSAGVSESWKNPEVAAKRKERSRVDVDGVVYKSVADAFRHLGIDMKNHITFRQELKANGTDEEWGHKWTILPGDAVVTAPKMVKPDVPATAPEGEQTEGEQTEGEPAEA